MNINNIELIGIPGPGKTTVCKYIQNRIGIYNPMSFYRDTFIGKSYMHLFWFLAKHKIIYRGLCNKIFSIIDGKEKNFFLSDLYLENYIYRMVFIYYVENRYKNRKMIVI